jgi:methylmalonyl-CoA/ethylmalonyl-CoA epimerase
VAPEKRIAVDRQQKIAVIMEGHRLHHVGIVVRDLDRVESLLDLLGLERGDTQYVPEYEADCVFTKGNGSSIEFIIPRGGKLTEFNRPVGGLHHVAIEVEDLEQFSEELRKRGVRLLEPQAVDAGGLKINFLSPVYTRGFTVEFVETKTE